MMKTKIKKYKSKIKEAIHQTAQDLHEARLMDNPTMRRFDASGLTQACRIKNRNQGREVP